MPSVLNIKTIEFEFKFIDSFIFFNSSLSINKDNNPRVLDYLKNNYPLKLSNKKFDNRDIYNYIDKNNNLFTYVETDKVLSYDYDKYIPILNELFSDYDIAGVVNKLLFLSI